MFGDARDLRRGLALERVMWLEEVVIEYPTVQVFLPGAEHFQPALRLRPLAEATLKALAYVVVGQFINAFRDFMFRPLRNTARMASTYEPSPSVVTFFGGWSAFANAFSITMMASLVPLCRLR